MTDTDDNQLKWMAFMAHIPATDIDYVEDTLKEYDIGAYILGIETEPYHHIHFVVQMTENHYHNFSKRVFKDKYNLRGRATKGSPRQYGRVKTINNLEKMKAYTLKDNNFRTNMTEDQIQKYVEMAFKKNDQLTLDENLLKDLYEIFHDYVEIDKDTNEEVMCPARGKEIYKIQRDCFTGQVAKMSIYRIYQQNMEMDTIPYELLRRTIIDLMKVWDYKTITKPKIESLMSKYITRQNEDEISPDMIYSYFYQ